MFLARGLVTLCCLICAMAGDCPNGRCAQGRHSRGNWIETSYEPGGDPSSYNGGNYLDIHAPRGAQVRILPAAGEPLTYNVTYDHGYYGLSQNCRGPFRVEARNRDGALLDFSVVNDIRRPIKLINTLDRRACQEPVETNYGLAVDTEGHPLFGTNNTGTTDGHLWFGEDVIPDHRGKKTLAVICDSAQEREGLMKQLQSGNFAQLTGNLALLDYPTGTWHVRDHKVPPGGKAIVVQEAQPSARVLHRQADFDLNTLGTALCALQDIKPPQAPEAVRSPDPTYRPELDPNLGKNSTGQETKTGIFIAALAGCFVLFTLRPKESRSCLSTSSSASIGG